MRIFAIYDESLDRDDVIGYLLNYERSGSFIIELQDDLTEWEAPLLFSSLVRDGIYTIPRDIAGLWVSERVIPSGRQNIGLILRDAKLTSYNEGRLLALSNARCAQDSCYISEIDLSELPQWVFHRQASNISHCFPIEDNRIVCLMFDDNVLEVDLEMCVENVPKIATILGNERIINSVTVDAGGYGVVFNDSILLSKKNLYDTGVLLPFYAHTFLQFAKHCVVNTSEACQQLGCSRQNMSYFVKNNILTPIKTDWKENVFLKGDLDRLD